MQGTKKGYFFSSLTEPCIGLEYCSIDIIQQGKKDSCEIEFLVSPLSNKKWSVQDYPYRYAR